MAGHNEDIQPHRKHQIDSLPSLGTHRCFTLPHLSRTLSTNLIFINYQFDYYLLFSNREGVEAVVTSATDIAATAF